MSPRPPLRGFNHNVRYRNRVYHVQTEDSGLENPRIFSHIFQGGLIVSTARKDYDDLLGKEDSDAEIKRLMQTQHKALMKRLRGGEFDAKIAEALGSLDPEADAAPPSAASQPTAVDIAAPVEAGDVARVVPTEEEESPPPEEFAPVDTAPSAEVPAFNKAAIGDQGEAQAVLAPAPQPAQAKPADPVLPEAPDRSSSYSVVKRNAGRFSRKHETGDVPQPEDTQNRRVPLQTRASAARVSKPQAASHPGARSVPQPNSSTYGYTAPSPEQGKRPKRPTQPYGKLEKPAAEALPPHNSGEYALVNPGAQASDRLPPPARRPKPEAKKSRVGGQTVVPPEVPRGKESSMFGSDVITERSLDEVILGYLSEERAEKKKR